MTMFKPSWLCLLAMVACSQMPMVSPTILKVSVPRNLSPMLILLAERENFFADAGLKVMLTVQNTPEKCLEDLTARKVDLALIDTPTWVYGDNSRVSILSEVYSTSRGMYLVVPQAKTKNLSEVKGRSLHFRPQSSEEWFVSLLSIAEGLDLNRNSIVPSESKLDLGSHPTKVAEVATDVELASLQNRYPLEEFGIFSSRVHFEIYFVAGLVNATGLSGDTLERFLTALHRAEQVLYVDAGAGDRALLSFLPELSLSDVNSLRSSSLFRVGLSNTLFVLLTEQRKWLSTRNRRGRLHTDEKNLRALIRAEFLKKIVPGAVTLTEGLGGS